MSVFDSSNSKNCSYYWICYYWHVDFIIINIFSLTEVLNNSANFISQDLIVFIDFDQVYSFSVKNFDLLVRLFHQTVNFFSFYIMNLDLHCCNSFFSLWTFHHLLISFWNLNSVDVNLLLCDQKTVDFEISCWFESNIQISI